ncbi:MAG: DUF4037 domain-containing protein [Eubacteriales bacterium]|nr:DUF4037 domain-containing protein [Eubacteriales bacterium]
MNGLLIAEKYYREFGERMLDEFGDLMPYIATGLIGEGSECMGYDDLTSRDHDFEPGFCIFIPNNLDESRVFALERAYSHLPKEYEGLKRGFMAPVGGNRRGVIVIENFLFNHTGIKGWDDENVLGRLTPEWWLKVPEQSLIEITNGKIFIDYYGLITGVREELKEFPEEIRLKKLAGYMLKASQSGQYNYKRCIEHGESGAAQMALNEFVDAVIHISMLSEHKYTPYYKWCFRAFRDTKIGRKLDIDLEWMISSDNEPETVKTKEILIENICDIISRVVFENLGNNDKDAGDPKVAYGERITGSRAAKKVLNTFNSVDLEKTAYDINSMIGDSYIRNLHILSGV